MRAAARSAHHFRRKQITFAAGGIASTTIVLLVLLRLNLPDVALSFPPFWQAKLPFFLLLTGVLFLGVTWPHLVRISGHLLPSDGMVIWTTLRMKRAEVPPHLVAHRHGLARALLYRGEIPRARDALRVAAAAFGDLLPLDQFWVHLLFEAGLPGASTHGC